VGRRFESYRARHLRGDLTTAQLAAKHCVHQTMISEWKRQAVEGLVSAFSVGTEAKEGIREGDLEKLHAKIGQLVGNGIFGESVRSMSMDRRRTMIEPGHPHLSVARQCMLVSIGRSTFYQAPTAET
jgi:hypothetical protein